MLLCAGPVQAQESPVEKRSPAAEVEPPPAPAEEKLRFEVWGGATGEAKVEGERGGCAISEGGLSLDYANLNFSYARKSYDWDNPRELPFGNGREEPWNGFQAVGFGLRHFGVVNRKWRYFTGGGLSSAFEDGGSAPVSLRAFGGLTYVGRPGWQVSFGLGLSHHQLYTSLMPMIGLKWNRGDGPGGGGAGWSLSLGFPETSVAYRFSPAARLRLGLAFDRDLYRLADGNVASPGGYLESQDLMVGLYLDLIPGDRFRLTLGLQHLFGRELTLYDRDERELKTFDLDPAPGAVVNLSFMF